MKEVAVYEAKTRLSELLVEVEQGEQVTITRRGLPIATGDGPLRWQPASVWRARPPASPHRGRRRLAERALGANAPQGAAVLAFIGLRRACAIVPA